MSNEKLNITRLKLMVFISASKLKMYPNGFNDEFLTKIF